MKIKVLIIILLALLFNSIKADCEDIFKMGGRVGSDFSKEVMAFSNDGRYFYFVHTEKKDPLSYSVIKRHDFEKDTTIILDSLKEINYYALYSVFNAFKLINDEKDIFAYIKININKIIFYKYNFQERKSIFIETHTDSALNVSVSNQANFIAVVRHTNEIRVLNQEGEVRYSSLVDREKKIIDVCYSQDEKYMALILSDSVYVYDTGNFSLFSSFFLSSFQNDRFKIDMEGDKLIKFLNDGYVLIYDLKTGQSLGYFNINLEGDGIRGVQLTKENYLMVFKSKTEVWDINTKKKIFEFDRIDENSVVSMGKSLVVSGRNKLEIWDYNKGILVKTFLSFYSRGSFICNDKYVSVSDDSGFQWNLLNTSNLDEIGKVNNKYAFHSSCNYIEFFTEYDSLSNIEFKKIRIRDFITEVVNDSFRFEGSFRKYLFSSDLKLLFLISYSNQLNVWNWQQKELIYTKSFDSIRSVSISPTSNFYLTKEFFGGKYHYNVYETVSGRLAYTFSEVPEHMYYVNYFDWVTNDKDYIIDTQGLNDGIYTIYNMPTGEIEKKYKLPDFLIFENRNWIFYDLDKIAYFDTSNTDRIYNINIYSLESSKVIYTIEIEYFFPINKFYFSSDKQLLLIYFLDGSILLKKIGSTDVKEIYSYKPNFSISPNPAGEYIEIKDVRAEHALPLQDIKIYNLFGECVMVEQSSPIVKNGQTGMSDLLRINISGLPAGVYFVRVGDWVGRFLKI